MTVQKHWNPNSRYSSKVSKIMTLLRALARRRLLTFGCLTSLEILRHPLWCKHRWPARFRINIFPTQRTPEIHMFNNKIGGKTSMTFKILKVQGVQTQKDKNNLSTNTDSCNALHNTNTDQVRCPTSKQMISALSTWPQIKTPNIKLATARCSISNNWQG